MRALHNGDENPHLPMPKAIPRICNVRYYSESVCPYASVYRPPNS
jgi:hypothetical protein